MNSLADLGLIDASVSSPMTAQQQRAYSATLSVLEQGQGQAGGQGTGASVDGNNLQFPSSPQPFGGSRNNTKSGETSETDESHREAV